MKFFLLSTDHLQTKLWFGDDADYAVAMNYVAITAYRYSVNVVAFILMSNHVHFILECEKETAADFVSFFKEMYGLYRRKRYGDTQYLRGLLVDIQNVPLENESMERAIAYVQSNSVAARLCTHPSGYPWGTGNVFFDSTFYEVHPVGSLSARKRASIMHSKLPVNPGWSLGPGGFILPKCYVTTSFVEGLFRTPSRYQYFLDNSSKVRKTREQVSPSFSDQLVLTASLNLCHSLFRANSIDDLSPSQTAELVKQLKRRFSSDAAQISRTTGVAYSEALRILESI